MDAAIFFPAKAHFAVYLFVVPSQLLGDSGNLLSRYPLHCRTELLVVWIIQWERMAFGCFGSVYPLAMKHGKWKSQFMYGNHIELIYSSMTIYVLVCVFSIARVGDWRIGPSSSFGQWTQIHRRTEFLDYDPDSACGRRTTSTLLGKVPVWIGGQIIFDWIPHFWNVYIIFRSI